MRKLRNTLAAKAKELDASRQGIHAVQEQAHKLRKQREDRMAERTKLEHDSTQVCLGCVCVCVCVGCVLCVCVSLVCLLWVLLLHMVCCESCTA